LRYFVFHISVPQSLRNHNPNEKRTLQAILIKSATANAFFLPIFPALPPYSARTRRQSTSTAARECSDVRADPRGPRGWNARADGARSA